MLMIIVPCICMMILDLIFVDQHGNPRGYSYLAVVAVGDWTPLPCIWRWHLREPKRRRWLMQCCQRMMGSSLNSADKITWLLVRCWRRGMEPLNTLGRTGRRSTKPRVRMNFHDLIISDFCNDGLTIIWTFGSFPASLICISRY